MDTLETLCRDLYIRKAAFTDAIAATYPVGSKVLIRSKHGWEHGTVTWTPQGSNGANPHIYVKRTKTGGEHRIDMNDISAASGQLVRKDFQS